MSCPTPSRTSAVRCVSEALQDVLKGTKKAEKRGASTVVDLGKADAAPTASLKKGGKSAKAAKSQYVELAREKTDKIFVVLAEFGDQRAPELPGPGHGPDIPGPDDVQRPAAQPDPAAGPQRRQLHGLAAGLRPGPLPAALLRRGQGRRVAEDVLREAVLGPLQRRRPGHRLGQGALQRGPLRPQQRLPVRRQRVLQHAGTCRATRSTAWVADQKAKGRTDAQIKADLASYDQWDRYDYDGDGNFNEPDGYIDHFQIVHAGGDQADGDPQPGRGRHLEPPLVRLPPTHGTTGPAQNKLGGTQIGNTGIWVGDYTIQPENGGSSVFAHEYGHDLGLPDHYDTSGGPARTRSNWWTLMAQSRVGAKGDQGIGDCTGRPRRLGQAAARLARLRDRGRRPEQDDRPRPARVQQQARPRAPSWSCPRSRSRPSSSPPAAGTKSVVERHRRRPQHHADALGRPCPPARRPRLSFQANWDIEDCGPDACDYAYVEVNDGSGFKAIPGSITKPAEGNGIDGASGGWMPATFDLSAYAGKKVDAALPLHDRRRAPAARASSPTRSS